MPLILPGLMIGGAVFFAGVLLLALSIASNSTYRPVGESQGILSGLTWATRLFGDLWHKLVRTTVSHFAAAHLIPLVRWFSSLNALVVGSAAAIADTAEETAAALERMRHVTIPGEAGKAVAPVKAKANAASRTAHAAAASAHSTSSSLHRYKIVTTPKVAHATHAIDVTIPGELGRIKTREDALSRDAAKLRERTKALENGAVRTFEWLRAHPLAGTTSVFAGAVAVALARLGYGFLRCRNWQSLGRRLTCGMGGFLLDLLSGIIDVMLIADLCQITGLMVQAADSAPVRDAIGGFIAGMDELLICRGLERPPALVARSHGLPPAQGFSALPPVS